MKRYLPDAHGASGMQSSIWRESVALACCSPMTGTLSRTSRTGRWSPILVARYTKIPTIAVYSISKIYARCVRLSWPDEHEGAGTTGIHSRYGGRPAGADRARAGTDGAQAEPGRPSRRQGSAARLGHDGTARQWQDRAAQLVRGTPAARRAAFTSCGFRQAESGPGRTWTTCCCRCPSSTGSCPGNSASPASAKPSGLRQLPTYQDLTARLSARCRRRPSVLLVDEAHTLDRDVGQLLLNVSQEVRANAPLLLVLAGTPGLPAHLSTMNASFWSRLDEGRMGIGLLSGAAARDALVKPLTAHGVSIDRGALDAAVEDSQPLSVLHPGLGPRPLGTAPGHWSDPADGRSR